MKILQSISQVALLYLFFYLGSWLQQMFHLLIPGSVIGMLLLFLFLQFNLFKPTWIEQGANTLINFLPLLFIPVTVGIINYFELFAGKGFFLVVIIFGSTVLVMVSSGHIAQYLLRRKGDFN